MAASFLLASYSSVEDANSMWIEREHVSWCFFKGFCFSLVCSDYFGHIDVRQCSVCRPAELDFVHFAVSGSASICNFAQKMFTPGQIESLFLNDLTQ